MVPFKLPLLSNPTMQLKEEVILLPWVGMGHLIPMVELAKQFINQGFSVTIVVFDPSFDTSTTIDPFIGRVSSDYPSLTFHRLPKVTPPPSKTLIVIETIRFATPHLLDLIKTSQLTSNVRALVLDMFCTPAIDIADELSIPSYVFFASAATSLATFLYFPTLQSRLTGSFRDLGNSPVHVPGLHPIPASDLPKQLLDRGGVREAMLSIFGGFTRASGIMINTFEWLEKRAVEALASGSCVPDGRKPPVYCIGPLITNREETHECLTWLDTQPERSVVFLSFGSMGAFSSEQLKEIAIGLEGSGQRFLWVVRSPPTGDGPVVHGPMSEPDLEALLPEGFMERTEGRGMVVKSWAPQVAVLRHKAVGGFVSHCGWNSTLEAVSMGVPIIAWPLYAEQRMNKVFLVEEVKLAVAMEGYDKDMVSAGEVETKIRWLMESEDGKVMKERAVAAKEKAVAALQEGGTSSRAWKELVRNMNKDGASIGAQLGPTVIRQLRDPSFYNKILIDKSTS